MKKLLIFIALSISLSACSNKSLDEVSVQYKCTGSYKVFKMYSQNGFTMKGREIIDFHATVHASNGKEAGNLADTKIRNRERLSSHFLKMECEES